MARRLILGILGSLLIAWGAEIRLFLTDGDHLLVREYQVLEDRVRYYSLDRSAWEEIPLDLIDLDRTRELEEQETSARQVRQEEDREQRRAERKARTELHRVPIDDGVYYLTGQEPIPVPGSEIQATGDKKRKILQIVAPVPIIANKTTMELAGEASSFVINESRPNFYLRLEKLSRFGIVRLEAKKGDRVVQVVQTVPQAQETYEEQEEIEVFRQQLAPNVYKIWPIEPLPAGEYALIDYTPGENDLRVWDFSCRPGSEAVAAGDKPPEGPAPDGQRP